MKFFFYLGEKSIHFISFKNNASQIDMDTRTSAFSPKISIGNINTFKTPINKYLR